VALQRLVHALGPESPATYPLLLPVLGVCTDPAQPDELNLLEDGLQLWLVALRHAPAPHPGLLADLFPHWQAAMQRSTEHIAVGGWQRPGGMGGWGRAACQPVSFVLLPNVGCTCAPRLKAWVSVSHPPSARCD
jgi:hypothetical protein